MTNLPYVKSVGSFVLEVDMQKIAVWIDHDEAKVFHVDASAFDETTVHSANHHVHRHPRDQETRTHNHPDDEHRFFHDVANTLEGADQILVVGPSVTKLHFIRYLHKQLPTLEQRVVGVETADHPTDKQLVAHVRQYFHDAPPRRGIEP
jgi:stalled ribosome rescue protein Dom34